MKCIVCGGEQFELIHHGTRDIPDVDVYKCCQCGGSQLSTFSQITDGFYENSGMHQNIEIKSLSDVQILEDDIRRSEMLKKFKGKILDFGCGGGWYASVTDANKSDGVWCRIRGLYAGNAECQRNCM